MNVSFYRLTCLTNLHMGSGESNYNIVDLEVERDPITDEPVMNASGIKGALRDACEDWAASQNKSGEVVSAFGSKDNGDTPGEYRFFSGDLLARPVRVSNGDCAYVLATSPDIINGFIRKLMAFGITRLGEAALAEISLPNQDGNILTGGSHSSIEGYKAVHGQNALLEALLGTKNWVLMSYDTLHNIDLPVMAHNVLSDGKSDNFWYEEVVPHESIFGMLIGCPKKGDNLIDCMLKDRPVVQFGAGASTGNGFSLMTKVVSNQ